MFYHSDRLDSVVGNELGNLREALEKAGECGDACGGGWLWLRCAVPGEKAAPDRRNFLAHAGLERNAVCYRRSDDIWLMYSTDHLATVYDYARSGLRN